jgi:hypothetical protein
LFAFGDDTIGSRGSIAAVNSDRRAATFRGSGPVRRPVGRDSELTCVCSRTGDGLERRDRSEHWKQRHIQLCLLNRCSDLHRAAGPLQRWSVKAPRVQDCNAQLQASSPSDSFKLNYNRLDMPQCRGNLGRSEYGRGSPGPGHPERPAHRTTRGCSSVSPSLRPSTLHTRGRLPRGEDAAESARMGSMHLGCKGCNRQGTSMGSDSSEASP